MNITHLLSVDMARRMPMVPVDAVQGDGNTRILKLTLLENGESWAVPEGVTGAVAFRKSDGTKGLYDTLPDGSKAVTVEGSTVSAVLAPQILSRAGEVGATVVFHDGDLNQLAAFPILIRVAANPAAGQTVSNDYYRYSTMAAVSDALSEMAPAILCETDGEVIAVADAADRPLKGLSIYGKTVQNGTPTPSAPVALESVGESIGVTVCGKNLLPFPYADGTKTHNGITYTVNADGSITANGTATANSDFNLCLSKSPFQLKEGEQYIYSGCPKGGSNTTYRIRLQDNTYYQSENDTGDGIAFTARYENFYAWIDIKAGTTLNNLTFYPMIRLASTGAEYEPYKSQTLTATAEGGLHGIGEVKDEIDFARGVRVRRINKIVLNGEESFTMQTNANGATRFLLTGVPLAYAVQNSQLCSHALYKYNGNDVYGAENAFSVYNEGWLFMNLNNCKTVDAFKAILAQQYANGTPVTVQYVLAEPIETPLTAEELAQFAALRTGKPNTTVINDSGAEMKLSYVADTKLYIDQKIAAISAAILG